MPCGFRVGARSRSRRLGSVCKTDPRETLACSDTVLAARQRFPGPSAQSLRPVSTPLARRPVPWTRHRVQVPVQTLDELQLELPGQARTWTTRRVTRRGGRAVAPHRPAGPRRSRRPYPPAAAVYRAEGCRVKHDGRLEVRAPLLGRHRLQLLLRGHAVHA
jgi:hypothetical protein